MTMPHLARVLEREAKSTSPLYALPCMQREAQQCRPLPLHLRMPLLREALKGWPLLEHMLWPLAFTHALVSSLCLQVGYLPSFSLSTMHSECPEVCTPGSISQVIAAVCKGRRSGCVCACVLRWYMTASPCVSVQSPSQRRRPSAARLARRWRRRRPACRPCMSAPLATPQMPPMQPRHRRPPSESPQARCVGDCRNKSKDRLA